MLYVWFGHDKPPFGEPCCYSNDILCSKMKSKDFTHPIIRRLLKEVDNITMDDEGRMYHPTFGAVNQSMISNGASNVILALKTELSVSIVHMGDNCIPFLLEVARDKDVYCVCNRVPELPYDFNSVDVRTGRIMTTRAEFSQEALNRILIESGLADE